MGIAEPDFFGAYFFAGLQHYLLYHPGYLYLNSYCYLLWKLPKEGPTKNQFLFFNELPVYWYRKLACISRRNTFNTNIQQQGDSWKELSWDCILPKTKLNLISASLYNPAETILLSLNKSWWINSYLSEVFTNSPFPYHTASHESMASGFKSEILPKSRTCQGGTGCHMNAFKDHNPLHAKKRVLKTRAQILWQRDLRFL